ncbi:hypothetical protein TanjilG_02706 [Lupinus angustifolius]|uniref:X8 domain-containing protein n=2 Tax=Lupinus angustifolius TaxID=3871 RepID=A0A4P1RBP1_LUPAN|nr:hypothetical protein TanjilG_02706 [Lupinus angustifolius]
MAKEASLCFLFLSFLITFSSGALVGLSSTSSETISFLQQSKVSSLQIRFFVTDPRILSTFTNYNNLSVDFYLNKSMVETFIASTPFGVSCLKTHVMNFLSQINIKSVIVCCGSGEYLAQNKIQPSLLSALKSVHSVLNKFHVGKEVKVSVAFPLSFLEKLNASNERELVRILSFIKETKSFVLIEDSIDGELSIGEHFVQSIIKRVTLAASILPLKDVPVILTIKSNVIPSSKEIAQFSERVSKYLEPRPMVTKRIVALYAEVHTTKDFAQNQLKREELELFPHMRRTLDDTTTNPPNTVFPTNPKPAPTPVNIPPDTPAIITVPSTNPVTIPPNNPAAMPVTVPNTTPVPLTPTNSTNNSPVVPVSNPPATTPTIVPGATPVQPVTNPAVSYPPPSASVPVINHQPPPANTNIPPATQGQSWCVAKIGATQSSLQSALDYACGNGADCSQIQQGGSCYSPVTLQNHASYAFNSYYQKHPAPTSCDFGGTATLVNTNPSSGSCILPSSSSSTTTPISSPPTTNTPSNTIPPPSTITPPSSIPTTPPATPTQSIPTAPLKPPSSSGTSTFGYGTPPSVLNSSNPISGALSGFPPAENPAASTSHSVGPLRPYFSSMALMISFVTARVTMLP